MIVHIVSGFQGAGAAVPRPEAAFTDFPAAERYAVAGDRVITTLELDPASDS